MKLLFSLLCIVSGTLADTPSVQQDLVVATRALVDWDLSHVLAMKEKALQGAWLDVIMNTFDEFCSVIVQWPLLPDPDGERLHLQFMTSCRNVRIPVTQAEQLLSMDEFDKRKELIIMATGWRNTVENSATLQQLWQAFKCRGDVNFIAVDAAQYLDTFYTWSSFNTQRIGAYLGSAIAQLVAGGVPLQRVHLIGHSLGAHIVGEAARQYTALTGRKLSRITALDPAKPCFRAGGGPILQPVRKGDAQLVVVVHTNAGILGQREPLGDLDFYAGGIGPIQPGCLTIECSHSRAVAYFVESIYPGQERNFAAFRCQSWTQLEAASCAALSTQTMGLRVRRTAPGVYYVPVRKQAPYGSAAKAINGAPLSCAAVTPCP